MAPWMLCCLLSLALYVLAKAWTFRAALQRGLRFDRPGSLGYLFLWPGMDPSVFASTAPPVVGPAPSSVEWLRAIGLTLAGALLVLAGALPWPPLGSGWLTLVGALLFLHFGLFHLSARAWRRRGVDVLPLMRAPIQSSSLAEFWGRRWNSGFHQLAAALVFAPVRSLAGARTALVATFLVSGLVHELVITVPAGSGHGLPTLYFLLQGLGVLVERSRPIRHGWPAGRRRLLTLLVAALPVPLLFAAPFVTGVAAEFNDALLGGLAAPLREPATLERFAEVLMGVALPLAALANLSVLAAGAQLPSRLRWREELSRLSRFNRRIFLTYYGFIGGMVVAFAALTWFLREALIRGDRSALAIALLMGLFWAARILVDLLVFRADDWPRGRGMVLGRGLLFFAFLAMTTTYLGIFTWHHAGPAAG